MDPRRLPPWARWLGGYAAALALSAGLGLVTPLGPGNGVFLAGVLCIFASIAHVRLGGERTIVGRSLKGVPQWGLDPEKRRTEVRRGLGLLLLGLALWGALGVATLAR